MEVTALLLGNRIQMSLNLNPVVEFGRSRESPTFFWGMTDGIEVARTHADSGQRLLELPREPIDIDANTLDDSADVEALKA